MEDVMQEKVKRFRWLAIVGLALLVVPVAEAKPVSLPQLGAQQQHGQTSQGLEADGLRLQAEARAYQASQEIRSESVAKLRAAKTLSQSQTQFASQQGESALGLQADGMRWNAIAKAYQSGSGLTGIQVHYPFANENTAAFKAAEQKASASSMPISENSPVEQRLETQSPSPAPISENSPVEQRLSTSSPVAAPSSGHGFDYGDAGIGAGIAVLLTSMLALGAGSAISRRRVAHS